MHPIGFFAIGLATTESEPYVILAFCRAHVHDSAYDKIASSPSVEKTMRAGGADVETVVQTANNT